MFYLTTHSTHFIYYQMGIRHVVKDHGTQEIHCCHNVGYSFRLAARDFKYTPSHRRQYIQQPLLHQLWRTTSWNEIAQWVHHEGSIWWPSHHEWKLYHGAMPCPLLYIQQCTLMLYIAFKNQDCWLVGVSVCIGLCTCTCACMKFIYRSVYVHAHAGVCLSFSVTHREREMFYLTTHSTHFMYGYMASDICNTSRHHNTDVQMLSHVVTWSWFTPGFQTHLYIIQSTTLCMKHQKRIVEVLFCSPSAQRKYRFNKNIHAIHHLRLTCRHNTVR